MNKEIEFDNDFATKLIKAQFSLTDIKLNFFKTIYFYMINSKFRIYKRLDYFLKDQLVNPPKELIDIAQGLIGKDHDETIINILKYVDNLLIYEHDVGEEWSTAVEILERKIDDCDGHNSLIFVLARLAGIPYWLIYSVIGDAGNGGHYYLLYWSTRYNKLVSIDATFYPSMVKVRDRPKFKQTKEKYGNMWFVFNDKIIFKPC